MIFSSTDLRVLIYLTDVVEAKNGAVEFKTGPILGPRGTTIFYEASTLHRGLANQTDQERWILALAFSKSNKEIQTIGEGQTVFSTNRQMIFKPGVDVDFYEIEIGEDVVPLRDTSTWGSVIGRFENVTRLVSTGIDTNQLTGDLPMPINQTTGKRTNIAMKASGFFYTPVDSDIIIRAITDDGSSVSIDGVNIPMSCQGSGAGSWGANGGGYNGTYDTDTISLSAGFHEITFWWYQGTSGFSLHFQYATIDSPENFLDDWENLLVTPSIFQPLRWLSEWSDTTVYNTNDIVSCNGSTYICKIDNHLGEQPSIGSWDLFGQLSQPSAPAQNNDFWIMLIFTFIIIVLVCILTYFLTGNILGIGFEKSDKADL
jgi:hypothetical protein